MSNHYQTGQIETTPGPWAIPGSGCLQLPPTATTAREWTVSHLHPDSQRLVAHHPAAQTACWCSGTMSPSRWYSTCSVPVSPRTPLDRRAAEHCHTARIWSAITSVASWPGTSRTASSGAVHDERPDSSTATIEYGHPGMVWRTASQRSRSTSIRPSAGAAYVDPCPRRCTRQATAPAPRSSALTYTTPRRTARKVCPATTAAPVTPKRRSSTRSRARTTPRP